jgi:Fe-S oxidoreductase
VPPEKLGAFLRDLFAVIERYGYKTPMYGHFGQGCVHLRMTFDFRTEEGILKYRTFIEEAADITLKYGGSFSGEHGDGQSRAALLPKMFGPELMRAFREFKALWDPDNRMNPGKVVDPVAVYDPTENLRFGAGYHPTKADTYFQYPKDDGSFSEATTRCIGVGACRSHEGTMCPSYMATLEEKHSTRGRAHLLWEMMQGDVVKGGWHDEAVHEALEYCLSCKACKTECPTQVDVAALKSEFLAHYYEGRRHPLHHYVFGYMDKWANMASVAPWLANLPMKTPGLNTLIKSAVGIAQQRAIPAFAAANFRDTALRSARPANTGEDVLLWPDTWNNYFHPQALHSAVKILKQAGKQVKIPKRHVCCGRPLYDFGFLEEARRYLKHILRTFAPQIDAGVPVVMLEPSCATVFRDELVNFFPNDERAIRLSRHTMMLGEVLASSEFSPPDISGRRIVVHGHCHQKTQMTMKHDRKLLEATGASVELLDSGCCGMAGPYGFEHDKYEISQTLANRVLVPAVRSAGPQDLIVSNGFSCREAIHQNSSRDALHISQVLAGDFECQGDA